jgi:hypothetical protein
MKNMPYDYEPPRVSFRPRIWPVITPELHEQIKRLYQRKVDCSGEVREFAKRHGLPRWKISRYAQNMGWTSKQKKEPDWSDKELGILERSAHHCPEVISRKLREMGYTRSIVGIVLKRKRMRFIKNLHGQSATQLAVCLGEDIHFVTRAIDNGLLKAFKRELNRTPQQGGNPYLIKDKDVREFIINNVHMIDLRKVDKYWFVDLLAGEK